MQNRSYLVLFILFSLNFSSSPIHAQDLFPCEAAATMESEDLILASRLAKQLGRDRAPVTTGGWLRMRVTVLPDYTAGNREGRAEWQISLYFGREGDGILELALPDGCIRAANCRYRHDPSGDGTMHFEILKDEQKVPVEFKVKNIPRDFAEQLANAVNQKVVRAKHQSDEELVIRFHATTFQFSAWELGYGERCSQWESSDKAFNQTALGKLTAALREFLMTEESDLNMQAMLNLLEKVLEN